MKTRKPTFRFNLYSIFIISILIPFSIASLTFTLYYNYIIQKRDVQNISAILASISLNIDTQLAELKNISTTCYMHSNILASMKTFNTPDVHSYYDSLELNRLENDYTIAMTKLMFTSQQAIYNISFFPVADADFFYSLAKNSAGIKRISFKGYHSQEWFLQALKADGNLVFYPAHTPYYLGEDNTPGVFSAVRLIMDMDSKKHIGILKIDSRLSNLEQLTDSIPGSPDSHIMITDASGQVVAGGGGLFVSLPEGIHQSGGAAVSVNGERYDATVSPLAKTNWHLVYLSNLRSGTERIILSILIAVSCMAAGTVIAFFVYRNRSHTLVQSIGNITETIRQFEQGNLQARSNVSADNELKTISDELNTMADNLDAYIKREYIAIINQQKAEYKALQSQINPHFLYNTLNGFIALNRMGEKKTLEKSIIQLTHMFRYTCQPKDTTTLAGEVRFLEEYLNLQKLKYDERLEFSIWLHPSCEDFLLPKLLLQPIVENSILHGLEPTSRPIHITILCQPVLLKGIGPATLILLSDDGVGCQPEKMLTRTGSVGFMNVRDRTLLFSPDAVCRVESTPGRGTKTMFLFPPLPGDSEERNAEPL